MTKKNNAYTISELASILDISPSTIRFYEEKGLISPKRTSGNQRIYYKKDRARMKLILRGKRFGFSLDEISAIIGMANNEVEETDQIEKSLIYAEKKIEDIRLRKKELILLEKDMIAMKEKLICRLKELKKNKASC